MSTGNSSSAPKKKKSTYLDGDYSNLADLAEKVDWFTQCHSPTEIFSFFSKDEGDEKDNSVIAEDEHDELQGDLDNLEESLAGASSSPYPLPASCEYCGAKSTKECTPTCSRPNLYLVKKRPPFLAPPTLQTEWNGSQVGPCDSEDVNAFETASSTISNFNEEKKDWMSEIGWRG